MLTIFLLWYIVGLAVTLAFAIYPHYATANFDDWYEPADNMFPDYVLFLVSATFWPMSAAFLVAMVRREHKARKPSLTQIVQSAININTDARLHPTEVAAIAQTITTRLKEL